jgi:hypothetical protein
MIALLCFFLAVLVSPFKSKGRLEAENAAVRHQMVVLRRMVHRRVARQFLGRSAVDGLQHYFDSRYFVAAN